MQPDTLDSAHTQPETPELRLVVKVTDAHPDLHAALLPIPVRKRAERMRSLALLGLAVLAGRQPAAVLSVPAATPAPPASPAEPDLADRRQQLLARLRSA